MTVTIQRMSASLFVSFSKARCFIKLLAIFSVMLLSSLSLAAKPPLSVAISVDMPPYVINQAISGLQVDIIKLALDDYDVRFVQMSFGEIQTAVQKGIADVGVGVLEDDSGVFYSDHFITFANVAVSKKASSKKIEQVADLKGHLVLTWQNAYLELGDAFEQLYSPQSPERENYIEVADQADQVRIFWQGNNRIAVIDRSIFTYFTKALGYAADDVIFHYVFPSVTSFQASFKEAKVRDSFNLALSKLCQSGEYDKLLTRYDVKLKSTVCENERSSE
ncbi:substrate-binding periplasmic protein [Photobacterium alginatilyticum]|uniref:substrate-binding periplasmic protein n=1 Tax=Photobacterium alginatilyticum TaxID=1775171 RepID=UPI00406873AD